MSDFPPIPDKDRSKAATLKDANQVLNGLIESGKSTTKTFKNKNFGKKLKKFLQVIAGVGYIVEGFGKFVPDRDDPLIELIDDLGKTVEALGDKVSMNLGEMKALITEINFFVRILSPAFKLMRYWRDCFQFPGKDANENFLRAYKKTPPLKLAYYLISYLEQESTNPLKHAMDLEKIKLKTTFTKWEDIFGRVMIQFMTIEMFAKNLMKKKSEATLDKIIEAFVKILTQLDKWKKEYEITGSNYWAEMEPWTENYLKNNSKLTNAEKADKIRDKMETYFLSHPVYIIVFNASKENSDYAYHLPRGLPVIKTFLNIGGSDVIIYESSFTDGWNNEKHEETEHLEDDEQHEPEALTKIKEHVNSFHSGKLTYNKNLNDIFEKQILPTKKDNEADLYFYALVYKDKKPEVRWANSPEFEKGPGWWTTVKIKDGSKPVSYDYILLASFSYSWRYS